VGVFDTVQGLVLLALWVVTLGVKAFAFIDCLRRSPAAFPAVGRQTKPLWLILTGLAAGTGVFPGFTLNLVGLAGIVIALVYLFDVRIKIIDITTRRW
jgi:NO-binding membrane sensor protein with MHYT domain